MVYQKGRWNRDTARTFVLSNAAHCLATGSCWLGVFNCIITVRVHFVTKCWLACVGSFLACARWLGLAVCLSCYFGHNAAADKGRDGASTCKYLQQHGCHSTQCGLLQLQGFCFIDCTGILARTRHILCTVCVSSVTVCPAMPTAATANYVCQAVLLPFRSCGMHIRAKILVPPQH